MGVTSEFVMSYKTIMFHPKYDEIGQLNTIVIDSDGPHKIKRSPTDLIDFNLHYFGYSLRGAYDGARAILGDIRMYPVAINEGLNLYWFPTKSPNREDCIWIGLHQIKEYSKTEDKGTHILFRNGYSIILDISFSSFDLKVQRAYKLKGKIEGRTKTPLSFVMETKDVYKLINDFEHP